MAEIKKKWIKIIAPKIFNSEEVGETVYTSIDKVVGKIIEVNIGFLINDVKRQHMKLRLKVKDINNNLANTEIIGYDVVKAYIRRSIRTDRSKIEDSFVAECKDKIKVRIKPMIITRYKTKRAVLTNLRKSAIEVCLDICKKNNYEDVIKLVINNTLQRELKNTLKKIFPIAFVEIKSLNKV